MQKPEFRVEYLDPRELAPHPANFRRHPAPQKEALASSISENGYLAAPIWNRITGHLLDGHLRVELAAENGEAVVPVRVIAVPEDQERRILASFDQIGELRERDDAALAALLSELKETEAGLPAGWQESDLEALLAELAEPGGGLLPGADPDAVPEEVETRCKAGDLWRLGNGHRLLCGDSTKREDVERLLSGEQPRLMATDPPYGVELDMEWRDRALKNALGAAERSYMKRPASCKNDEISSDTRADWSEAFALVPSLQVAYVWHADRFSPEVHAGLRGIGFEHFQLIVWDKQIPSFSRCHYWQQHEPCWYARKKNAPWYGQQGAQTNTVWSAPSPKHIMSGSKEEKLAHPTQKPVSLWEQPIRNHSVSGELLYEPFGGSGTTLMAGEQQQRRVCCMEIEPRYCDIILTRWEAATGQTAERLS